MVHNFFVRRARIEVALFLLFIVGNSAHADEGKFVPVPGVQATPSGWGTFVAAVKVPASWCQTSGLMSESVTISLGHLEGAAQVLLNQQPLGDCGQLPPDFAAAHDEQFRWKVPPGSLKADSLNWLVIRMYGKEGQVGFKGESPVLSGYHDEIRLAGQWWFEPNNADAKQTLDAERFAAHVFEQIRPATSRLFRPQSLTPGNHLSVADSWKAGTTPEDLAFEIVLSEPEIAQPLAIDFDDSGRMWVTEYRQYPFPAGLEVVSRDKFYRAVYDQTPRPPPHHVVGADRISIHADSDGDGTLDQHLVFVDGLNMISSVEVVADGVWVLNPPFLLFYADRNHDDVPDGSPEVHLEGFGLEDTHSLANSLTWGPDGWLYGAQGSTTSSRVRVVGHSRTETYRDGAMIWRYHPQTRQYEIFAEGGGNAFGIEIDAAGRLFSGHNGGDTRGFHYVQGGYYQKGTKYGPVSNAFTFGEIGFMPHPPTPRFSHDLVCYEDTALPARYHGAMFSIDPLKGTVFWVQRSSHGSSFETKDLDQIFQTTDFAFRPVDITVGPDGNIYVADFCEEFIAHGQHFQGQVDPSTGRIYRLRAANERTDSVTPNAGQATDDSVEWIHQLTSANRTVRRRTLRRISESKLTAHQQLQLQKWLQDDFGQTSLEALWALNLQNALTDEKLQSALQHPSADVRRWAVRLAAERPHLPKWLASELPKLAAVEANAEVRSQLASSAKKLSQRGMPDECLAIVVALSDNAADLQDPAIPLLIWWAWEATTAYPDSLQRFLQNDAVWRKPLFANHTLEWIARRLASGDQRELALCHALLNHLKTDPALQTKVLAGIQQAWETRPLEAVPATLLQSVLDAGGGSLELKIRLGDEQAIQAAFQLMEAATMPSAKHERLLQRLANTAKQDVLDRFLKWLANPDFPANQRATLIAVLAEFDSPEIAAKLLESWDRFDRNQQQVAVRTLAVRSAWSNLLLQQVQAKRIDRALISAEVVRSLMLHQDQNIQTQLRELELSSVADPAAVDEAERQRVISAAALPNADPYVGEKLFLEHCGKCHKLFRQGGNIGPDLTSYQRNDVERFILNVVAPNLEIREGFETWSVLTDDGRIVNGFMADQDANTVVLRTSDGQAIVIERTAIDHMERSPFSVMPTGITNLLTNDQLRDLFGYLRQSQPVTP